MLGKLFKPRWQHRDAEVRAQAAAALDPRQDQETLTKLAREDHSPRVRAVSVAALRDLNFLDRLIVEDSDSDVRDAASERFMALLAGTVEGAPPAATRQRLIEHTDNPRVLHHVARHSPDDPCRRAALAAIDDPQTLYRLAVDGGDAALRLAAANRLHEPTLLRQLGREGRDKKVIRLARDRLKARQAEDADARRHEEQLDALIQSLEQLAQHSADPLFEGRLQQLEQRWQALAEGATDDGTDKRIDDARAARAETALGECRAHLREQHEAQAREAARESAGHERRAALDTLRALYRDLTNDTWDQQLGELRSAVATQERRWQAAGEVLGGDDEAELVFHSQLSEWRRLIGLAEAALDAEDDDQRRQLAEQWPPEVAAPSALAQALPEPPPASESQAPVGARAAADNSEHRGLVVALRRELQRGNLKHANRLWHKAEAVLAEQQDSWLRRQLERLSPRREELRDWHAFAAQPKKDQLCERMETLADSDMDAEERASAIQALHEEWRALMTSDQDQDQAQWDRFKAASDKAYQPCRAHFAELDVQRAENLERRRALCQQLAEFVAAQDWQQADWQAVWEIRRQAPREWKSHAPVRFTDARETQKRFSALLSEIDQRLEEAWRQAEQSRQALLERAAALAEGVAAAHASEEGSDVRGAAREAQALQKQWRAAPWLPPARHRPFQKRFRRTMDTIFAARQADSEQKQAQRAEVADQAQAVLERAARQTARPLSEQDGATLAALAEELQALDSASLGRGLQQQLQRLQEQLRALRKDLPRWRRWQATYERIAGAPAGDERGEDRALAAALEALAGVDSPPHAREERMAWQLERLPKAMKSSGFTPLEEALSLVDERPVGTALDSDLAARMAAALTALEPRP